MYNEAQFQQAIKQGWDYFATLQPSYYENNFYGQIRAMEGYKSLSASDKADYYKSSQKAYAGYYGWELYQNAYKNALNALVLGELATLRKEGGEDLFTNFGTTSYTPDSHSKKFFTGQKPEASQQTGSILSEQYWWPLMNDCWLLGGVHRLCVFYLAYKKALNKNFLWSDAAKRPTILGRELIALEAFGYKRISHPYEADLGFMFGVVNGDAALNATFEGIREAVTACANVESIVAFLKHDTVDGTATLVLAEPVVAWDINNLESIHWKYELSGIARLTGRIVNAQRQDDRLGQFVEVQLISGKQVWQRQGFPTEAMFTAHWNKVFIHRGTVEAILRRAGRELVLSV
ncbi:hypothetical protein [Pseudomonas sp. CFII68]|uniref:hypothetical protein n=1 Tax=Pseudomonas sp. CFII68 TaxID=911243 RepID=UPI00035514E1|nr:hypothetical protein [Pseudomonas sp. CFII68]EPJ95534.1 hypothetical protein CFII68_06754 [Pseudomonas sp. CFII68]